MARLTEAGLACSVFDAAGLAARPPTGRTLKDWLKLLPTPTAIFAASDHRALDPIGPCRELNLHVPHDIAVMGVDHDEVEAVLAGISLTSVELNTAGIGHAAATMLAVLLAGRKPQQTELRIPPLQVVAGDSTATNPVQDPRLRAVLDYINQHHTSPIYTDDLCRLARLPRRMLERRFRQLLGRSPNAHIQKVRIARAKVLLTTTNWSITRIGDTCGFEGKKFAARFRVSVGMTPRQYREMGHSR